MRITFTRLTDTRHAVDVERDDGTHDRIELDTRSFAEHDLVHLAVEQAFELRRGYWGSVAAGAGLHGRGLAGDDITLAERLVGPLQTLLRTAPTPEDIHRVIALHAPQRSDRAVAARIHEHLRRLLGHWRATPHGGRMVLHWP